MGKPTILYEGEAVECPHCAFRDDSDEFGIGRNLTGQHVIVCPECEEAF